MSRVRGKKREEIIEKWLNGVEDPVWEVMPTSTEGKYIVKKRKSAVEEIPREEDTAEINNENDYSQDESSEDRPPRKARKKAAKPKVEFNNNNGDVQLQILEQLRRISEENARERERREQKSLMQNTFRKEFWTHCNLYQQPQINRSVYEQDRHIHYMNNDENESSEEDEKPVIKTNRRTEANNVTPRPQFMRRKLNFLDYQN